MACGFCNTTPINPCPVCGPGATNTATPVPERPARRRRSAPATQAAPQARPAAVQQPTPGGSLGRTGATEPRWRRMDPAAVLKAAVEIRARWAANDRNTAIALMVGLAYDGVGAQDMVRALALNDQEAARTGSMSFQALHFREQVLDGALKVMGFDPRVQDPPGIRVDAHGAAAQEPVRVLSCGCCTAGCVCRLHCDLPRGIAPRCCALHPAKAPATAGPAPVPKWRPPAVVTVPAAPVQSSRLAPEDYAATPAERAPLKALGDGVLPPLRAGDWAELGRRVAAGQLSEEDARGFGAVWVQQAGGAR